jgi:hypothetical protein
MEPEHMARHLSPSPSSPELLATADGSIDPELVALPRPPRLERLVSLSLMILTSLLAAAMAIGLAGDVRYAAASAVTTDIGELDRWAPDSSMSNRFVRATGRLGPTGAIRYDRPMERDSFRLAPVVGNDLVWVEMRVPAGAEPSGFASPTTYVGRLLPLKSASFRYRGLERSVREVTGAVIRSDAWVLIDGATPMTSRWTVALALLFAAFAGYNMVTIARIMRPVKR